MPRLATTSWRRRIQNAVPWPFSLSRETHVVAGFGKARASRSFFLGAPSGGRQAWQRYRPGVRGLSRDDGTRSAQIGAVDTPTAACVEPIGRCFAGLRRSKDRACWRPCFQRHGHPAGDRKNWALTPFVTPVLPGSLRGGTRPTDAATIQSQPSAGPNTGRRRKEAGHMTQGGVPF